MSPKVLLSDVWHREKGQHKEAEEIDSSGMVSLDQTNTLGEAMKTNGSTALSSCNHLELVASKASKVGGLAWSAFVCGKQHEPHYRAF